MVDRNVLVSTKNQEWYIFERIYAKNQDGVYIKTQDYNPITTRQQFIECICMRQLQKYRGCGSYRI
jgi:hypothetical protein